MGRASCSRYLPLCLPSSGRARQRTNVLTLAANEPGCPFHTGTPATLSCSVNSRVRPVDADRPAVPPLRIVLLRNPLRRSSIGLRPTEPRPAPPRWRHPAANRASRVFCQKFLRRRDVHDTLRQEPLQPRVLRFQSLETPRLRHLHPAAFRPPHVAGRAGNSDPVYALSPRHDVVVAVRMPEDRPALVWRGYERTT